MPNCRPRSVNVWRTAGQGRRWAPGATTPSDRRDRSERRKLFELYYGDQISADSLQAEDLRLNAQLEALQAQPRAEPENENVDAFDQVVAVLAELDWDAATDQQRRTLLDAFLVRLDVFADHLEVEIRGAGKLNVALHEVGRRNRSVEIDGVEGPR